MALSRFLSGAACGPSLPLDPEGATYQTRPEAGASATGAGSAAVFEGVVPGDAVDDERLSAWEVFWEVWLRASSAFFFRRFNWAWAGCASVRANTTNR